MQEERLEALDLPPMVRRNTAKLGTPFTVSVDAIHGTTTGISAYDRAVTIAALIDPRTRPDDLARPGHVFPLIAAKGGVLRRAGHTEATVDLATLAGLYPAGVLCEILHEDGTMARLPELKKAGERARAQDPLDRLADRAPQAEREAGPADHGDAVPDPVRGVSSRPVREHPGREEHVALVQRRDPARARRSSSASTPSA